MQNTHMIVEVSNKPGLVKFNNKQQILLEEISEKQI